MAKGMGTQITRTAPVRGSALVGHLQQRPVGESAVSVQLDTIASNPANPADRETGDLTALAESIREVGIVQALTVVPAANWLAKHPQHSEAVGQADYVLLAGHRRRAAAASVGQTHVPVLIRPDLADMGASDVQLHENLHRMALTPIQEALAYQAKVDEGFSQRQIAAAVKVSQGQVAKRLSLLKLPTALQAAVDQGWYTVAHMLDVLKLDDEVIEEVAQQVADLTSDENLDAQRASEADLDLTPVEALSARAEITRTSRELELPGLIRAAEFEVLRRRRYAIAESRAAELGAEVVEDANDRFHSAAWRHEVSGAAVERHAKKGNLVVGPGSTTEPRYYALAIDNPKTPANDAAEERRAEREAAEKRKAKGRREGQKTRMAALVRLVAQKPSAADLREQLVRHMLEAPTYDSNAKNLALKIAQQAEVGPQANGYSDWMDAVTATAGDSAREHLAWVLVWAVRENQHHQHTNWSSSWGAASLAYFDDLHRLAGYEPGEWEAEQLASARETIAAREANE